MNYSNRLTEYKGKDHSNEMWKQNFGDLKPGDPKIKEILGYKNWCDYGVMDEEGKPLVNSTFGFATQFRISRGLIEGIVVDTDSDNYDSKFLIDSISKKIADLFTKKKLKKIIPIYDVQGNMLWPKQVPNESIV